MNRGVDQILCIQELKLQLLAKSSICPGIITMIWALITSNTTGVSEEEDPDDELIEYVNHRRQKRSNVGMSSGLYNSTQSNAGMEQRLRMLKDISRMDKWHFNYLNGTKYELYRVPFKQKRFAGLKFREICMILYKKMNLTLIGLEIKVGNQVKAFLNPADYVF